MFNHANLLFQWEDPYIYLILEELSLWETFLVSSWSWKKFQKQIELLS